MLTEGVSLGRQDPRHDGIRDSCTDQPRRRGPGRAGHLLFRRARLEGAAQRGDYAMIGDGTTSVGFGRVPGYSAPGWPVEAAPKRYHLDFYVDDLEKAEEQALAL